MNETTTATPAASRAGSLFLITAGGIGLFALVALTVTGVLFRYGFGAPIFGLEDISKLTLSVVVSCGVALAALSRVHIAVDLLVNLFPPSLRRAVFVLVTGIGAVTCAFAAYALFSKGSCGRPCGEFSSNLSISHVPFYYAIGTAFVVFTAIQAFDLFKSLTGRS